MGELRLLEVGGDPQVGERDDGHQVLAGGQVCAHLYVLLVDDSRHRRGDARVAEVQPRLLDARLGLLDGCRGGGGAGLLHTDLVGAVLHRLRRLRLGLGETLARAGDGVLRREHLGLGLGDGGLRGHGCGHRSVVLLLGDHVLLHQRGVAIDVRLRLERVGLGLGDACVGGLHLFLRLRNHIGCPLHVAGGGADHGADRDLRDGDVNRGLGVLGLRAGQVGLRLIERDLVVGGIDLGQQLARLHGLVVVHGDLHHLARNARADLVQVAVHLRVVGVFDEGGAPEEEGRAENDQQHDADDDELAVAVGLGGVVGPALRDGAGLGCGLVGGLRAAPVLFVCHGYFPPR